MRVTNAVQKKVEIDLSWFYDLVENLPKIKAAGISEIPNEIPKYGAIFIKLYLVTYRYYRR